MSNETKEVLEEATNIAEDLQEMFDEKQEDAEVKAEVLKAKIKHYGKIALVGLGVGALGVLAYKALADDGEEIIEGVFEEIGE